MIKGNITIGQTKIIRGLTQPKKPVFYENTSLDLTYSLKNPVSGAMSVIPI